MARPLIYWELNELLEGIDGVRLGEWQDVVVGGICINSLEATAGDLFFALPGHRVSGARYARDAASRGARAVILPADVADSIPGVAVLKVGAPRQVLPRVAAKFYGNPSRDLFVFGATGTNGKSTLVNMVAQVLRAAARPAGYWSTPEVYTGRRSYRPILTTPEAHDLQRFLYEVKTSGMRDACIEVSSHGVQQLRIKEVHFNVGAVTNVTQDHLDYHKDFPDYVAAKRDFVRGLSKDAVCFLNQDDPWVASMGEHAHARIFKYGFTGASLQAVDPEYSPSGSHYKLRIGHDVADAFSSGLGGRDGRIFEVVLSVPGRHNVLNSLAAIGAGLAAGIPMGTILKALREFRPPLRRLETLQMGPYAVINDVAANRASYEAVLETMETLRFTKLIVVNAIRGNRGGPVNAEIAQVLAGWNRRLDFAPLIVSISRSHVKKYSVDYQVRPEELKSFLDAAEAGGLQLSLHEELPDAIAEGVERLVPGAALLLLGTFGMDEGHFLAAELLRRRVAEEGLAE